MRKNTAEWLSIFVGYGSLYYLSSLFVKQADHIKKKYEPNPN